MYHKLIACLLVFFLFCSPAYASTSSSAIDWQVAPMSLDDGIMTAAVVDSFSIRARSGQYNMNTDSYTWGSWLSRTATDGVISSTGYARYTGTYENNGCMAFQIEFSNFGDLEKIRALLGRIQLFINYDYGGTGSVGFYQRNNQLQLFSAYVDYDYSGTLYKYNSSGTTSVLTSSASYTENLSGASFSPLNDDGNRFNLLLDTTLPMGQPVLTDWKNNSDGIYDEVRHVTCDSFTLTFVIRLSNNWITSGGETPMFQYVTPVVGTPVRYNIFIGNQVCTLYDTPSGGDTSGIGSLQSSIQSSITSLAASVTEQITEVKETVQQGASEVKNEISNQTTTLSDKLTDVKDGIVQGVTELKETTEQGFEDVVQGITDLPDKIQEMLTEFIVPDEDAVADKMTDFQDLAEEKLGIIYQVPEMLFDAVNALVDGATNPQSTMSFPAFSLPWIDGSQLRVWDSQQFEIIPSGLENLRDLIQTVTSMVFVIMTFNSLKRAYERFFLGGGS